MNDKYCSHQFTYNLKLCANNFVLQLRIWGWIWKTKISSKLNFKLSHPPTWPNICGWSLSKPLPPCHNIFTQTNIILGIYFTSCTFVKHNSYILIYIIVQVIYLNIYKSIVYFVSKKCNTCPYPFQYLSNYGRYGKEYFWQSTKDLVFKSTPFI